MDPVLAVVLPPPCLEGLLLIAVTDDERLEIRYPLLERGERVNQKLEALDRHESSHRQDGRPLGGLASRREAGVDPGVHDLDSLSAKPHLPNQLTPRGLGE